jgi:uncharacterized protein YggE
MFRFAGLLAVVLAFAAAGCSGSTTILDSSQASPGITVTGEGSVFGTPDIAVVTLGAEANAATVSDARSQAGQSMDAMLKALKDGGVAEKDVQTTRFSVQPQYDFTKQQQTIIGFIVSNIATIKIRDIDKTGELIDAAVGAGGDRTRVENLQFTIDDPATLEDQAREKAMAEAKSKADALAKAGGVQLGKPRSITEGGGVTPIAFDQSAFREAAAGAPSTQIQVGQLEVTVQVSVVYGLD